MLAETLEELGNAVDKAHESLKRDLSKIRAGRANPGVLDGLRIDYYGTPTPDAPSGKILIYEIDVQGARQVQAADPSTLLVFLEAPSLEEQQQRLRRRGDPEEMVAKRVAKAREEADVGTELGAHPIVNRDVKTTVEELHTYILQRFGGA